MSTHFAKSGAIEKERNGGLLLVLGTSFAGYAYYFKKTERGTYNDIAMCLLIMSNISVKRLLLTLSAFDLKRQSEC